MEVERLPLTATALYDRHLADVYRYVSRRVVRREDAEDITSEVFQDGFRYLNKLRAVDHPRVWLYGIARRKVVDHLRRSSRRPESLACEVLSGQVDGIADSNGNPEVETQRNEARIAVHQVIRELNDDYREALLLRYVEDCSIAEIAQVLGRSYAATNSLLQRARASAFEVGRKYFLESVSSTANPR